MKLSTWFTNPDKASIISNWLKNIGLLISALGSIVGLFYAWTSSQNTQLTEIDRDLIREKISWQEHINAPITDLRELYKLQINDCNYNVSQSPYKKERKRIKARFKIIKATPGLSTIFGLEITPYIFNIISFDESTLDACVDGKTNLSRLLELNRQLNGYILNSINKDHIRIRARSPHYEYTSIPAKIDISAALADGS